VYNAHDYESDKWDPMEYGKDINPDKSFTEQFKELIEHIPHQSLMI